MDEFVIGFGNDPEEWTPIEIKNSFEVIDIDNLKNYDNDKI